MENCRKRPRDEDAAAPTETIGGAPPIEGFPILETILHGEIFPRLELESLCSLACVCRGLRSAVSQRLSALCSLDLSAFSPNGEIVAHVVRTMRGLKSVTIDGLHLNDFSAINILGPNIEELKLLKWASLSYDVLPAIGERCPNLRILVLELAGQSSPHIFRMNLQKMLERFTRLEYLSIKVRGTELDAYDFGCIDLVLSKALNFLKLQPVYEKDAIQLIEELGDNREIPGELVECSIPSSLPSRGFTLLRLSLVLNVISDGLMASITSSLRHLVELDLEDRPCAQPKVPYDLTNNGLQYLHSCKHLACLSIVRSRLNCPVSFTRVNDLGVMLLSESHRGLESVRLGGFSKVTDAGFSSILGRCYKLKKFEVRNAQSLTDLAFHDIIGVLCPLVELKLLSCKSITSEAVAHLASSNTLEVLDTNGCKSIADPCLECISRLSTLTSLNLGGADITDGGLVFLSGGNLPLTNLCLRGCTRVTDWGIIYLLSAERIKKTLSSLDLGHMPGISDRAVHAIVSSAESITELCIRYCFHVTCASIEILSRGRLDGSNSLHKLDICHCRGLSGGLIQFLQAPFFRGLKWLGVGGISSLERDDFATVGRLRPWLTVCFEGCEFGCHDGWQFHRTQPWQLERHLARDSPP